MSKRSADNRAEVRNRLIAGERIIGPAAPRRRSVHVRRFAWPSGSTVHEHTVRPMIEAGELALIPLEAGRHELVLA